MRWDSRSRTDGEPVPTIRKPPRARRAGPSGGKVICGSHSCRVAVKPTTWQTEVRWQSARRPQVRPVSSSISLAQFRQNPDGEPKRNLARERDCRKRDEEKCEQRDLLSRQQPRQHLFCRPVTTKKRGRTNCPASCHCHSILWIGNPQEQGSRPDGHGCGSCCRVGSGHRIPHTRQRWRR